MSVEYRKDTFMVRRIEYYDLRALLSTKKIEVESKRVAVDLVHGWTLLSTEVESKKSFWDIHTR